MLNLLDAAFNRGLALTSEGQPSHPLYLAYGLQPIPYYVTSNTALSGTFGEAVDAIQEGDGNG